mmetsp:Transcript_8808/g.10229  ORF Transcript_8808/g.10229 Transcript_8808/m.10229 type:complete len:190 (-) Transcript_8808:53-622(-)
MMKPSDESSSDVDGDLVAPSRGTSSNYQSVATNCMLAIASPSSSIHRLRSRGLHTFSSLPQECPFQFEGERYDILSVVCSFIFGIMFSCLFLWTGLVANILNVIGIGVHFISPYDSHGLTMGVFICGFSLFVIQPIFLALSMVRGQVVFLIRSSKRELMGSDEDDDDPTATKGMEMPLLENNGSDDMIV